MSAIDRNYNNLLTDVVNNGFSSKLIELPGIDVNVLRAPSLQLTHSLKNGFPIITTKEIRWRDTLEQVIAAFSKPERAHHIKKLLTTLESGFEERLHYYPTIEEVDYFIAEETLEDFPFEILPSKKGFALKFHKNACNMFADFPEYLVAYAAIGAVLEKQTEVYFEELIADVSNAYVFSRSVAQIKRQLNRDPVDAQVYLSVTPFAKLHKLDIKDMQVVNYMSKGPLPNNQTKLW